MEVSFGGSHRLSNAQALALLLTFVFFGIATAAFGYVAESDAAALVAVLLALAFIVGSIVFTVGRARYACYLVVDEGGIRVTTRLSSMRGYIPFTAIKNASFRRFVGLDQLHLETTTGGVQSISLAEAHAVDLEAIRAGVARTHTTQSSSLTSGMLGMLVRNRQPLDVWLKRIRDMATADYRERHLDPDELIRAVEDPSIDLEIRAAAAHALIWLRDEERAPRVMAIIGRNTPPLITVATTLATKLGTYVGEYEEALEYLSPEDQSIAMRMVEERPRLLRVGQSQNESVVRVDDGSTERVEEQQEQEQEQARGSS